jgi:xanthine dehydrogenase accessory factor
MTLILVCGSGDVGSAVAHALFAAHHQVILQDDPAPAYTRRGMAFTDAFFDGKAELEQVIAKRSSLGVHLQSMLACGRAIPALTVDRSEVIDAVHPDIVIDARMKKRAQPEMLRGAAPLTLGLGPNFVAGDTTDIVIETSWEAPGRVIKQGAPLPLRGEPQALGGHGRARYVYALDAGVFETQLAIGDRVESGQVIATLAGKPILAPLSGRLRGLTHASVTVAQGAKIVEVDPREPDANVYGIGKRPRRIAAGVLTAIK